MCIHPTVYRYLIDFRYRNYTIHNTSVHVFTMYISVVLHNGVVHGVMCLARPSDERPPVMYGHFCLVPRVSAHRRYYCICLYVFTYVYIVGVE